MALGVPPIPDAGAIALAVVAFLAGATAPTYYAQERLRGFGRWAFKTALPYQPPPGMQPEDAMIEATDDDATIDDQDAGSGDSG